MIDEEEKSTTRALISVTTRGRDSLVSLFVGLVERLTSGALCKSASVFFLSPLLSFIARSRASSVNVISVLPYIEARVSCTQSSNAPNHRVETAIATLTVNVILPRNATCLQV